MEVKKEEINKTQIALNRIKAFLRYLLSSITRILRNMKDDYESNSQENYDLNSNQACNKNLNGSPKENHFKISVENLDQDAEMKNAILLKLGDLILNSNNELNKSAVKENGAAASIKVESSESVIKSNSMPPSCFPNCSTTKRNYFCCKVNNRSMLFSAWTRLRIIAFKCVEHKYFEIFIIIMIIMSSITLVRLFNFVILMYKKKIDKEKHI